jgi:uncharacterized protein (TIRG00374 family)
VAESGPPEQGLPRRRRPLYRDPRYVILAVLAVAIAALAAVNRRELVALWRELRALRYATVALALACQFGKFLAIALTFYLLLRVLDHRIPIPYLFGSGLAMMFLNQTIPSMGTSGNAFMYTALQRRGVSGGSAVIVTILNLLTFYIAFFLLALGAVAYLAWGHALRLGHVIGLCVFMAMMLSLFVWIKFRTRTQARLRRTVGDINRAVARVSGGSLAEAVPGHFVDDFFEGRALIVRSKRRFILPVATNLGMFLADTATLFVVFRGLGHPEVLYRFMVAGYVLGIILYAFAFVPGALGIYEFGMAGMFIALGIARPVAFAAAILFRGFNFWLPIPIGFAIYHAMLHRRRTPAATAEPVPVVGADPGTHKVGGSAEGGI